MPKCTLRGAALLAALLAFTAGGFAAASAEPVSVIATLVAAPGKTADLKAVLVTLSHGAAHEPGCLSYTLLQNNEHPDQFSTYEIWADKAAIDAHMKGPSITAALPKLQGLLAGVPGQAFLTAVP